MRLSEVSKRVEKAIEKVVNFKSKGVSYDELGLFIEKTANEFNLKVDFIRKVSGFHFNDLSKVLRAYKRILDLNKKVDVDVEVRATLTDKFNTLLSNLGEIDTIRFNKMVVEYEN